MKKYSIFILVLVLTAATLMGCGCTNQDAGNSSTPTVLPTNEEVKPTVETTQPTTASSAPTTMPTESNETIDRGNGPLEDSMTESTGANGGNARSGGNGGMGSNGGNGGMGSNGGNGTSGRSMIGG